MKIQNEKKDYKYTLIALSVMLIAFAVVAFLIMQDNLPQFEGNQIIPNLTKHDTKEKPAEDENTDTNKPTVDERQVQTPTAPVREKEKDTQPAYEGKNVTDDPTLSGVVTYSSVVDNKLIIRTTINQLLSDGECHLTLSSGDKSVNKIVSLSQEPSSSSCNGFEIPVSELSAGDWTITIKVKSGDRNGILSGKVKI